jgi:hypothetical protein
VRGHDQPAGPAPNGQLAPRLADAEAVDRPGLQQLDHIRRRDDWQLDVALRVDAAVR